MAIIVGKEQRIPFTGALKDSRAEGYVSYFTKAGWDRWKMAAASVERDIADRDKEYDAALDMYSQQLKELATTKDGLTKKIADIQAKAAAADIKREDARWKAEEARQLQVQKQETEKAKGVAKEPSKGGSQRTSTSQRTGSSGGAGGGGRGGSNKNPYDEAMDEITAPNRLIVDDRMRTLSGGLNSSNVGDRWNQLDQLNKNGTMPSDAYTRGMSAYTLYENSLAALQIQNPSTSKDDLKIQLLGVLPPALATDVAYGESLVNAKAAAQQGGGAGGGTSQGTSSSQGTSFSRGAYQNPYDIAAFDQEVADLDKLGVTYKDIEDKLTAQLDVANKKNITVPTFEKIDLITATRKAYDDKFGDIPKGTTLQFDSISGNTYRSELQPYELMNALNKTEKFFKLYIEAEVNAATDAKGSPLNTDEQDRAVEAGKQRAREVLFGGLGQRKPTDEQIRERSNELALLGLPPDATDEEIRTARNKDNDELQAAVRDARLKRSNEIALLGLPPDATDEEIRTARNKEDDEQSAALRAAADAAGRKLSGRNRQEMAADLGLPPDATMDEVRAADRLLKIKLLKLPPNATDEEIRAAEAAENAAMDAELRALGGTESAAAVGATGSISEPQTTSAPPRLTTPVPGPDSSGIIVTEGGSGGTGTNIPFPVPGLKTYGPRQPLRQSELDALFPNGVPQEVSDAVSKMQRSNPIPVSRTQMQNYGGSAPIPPADGRSFGGFRPNIGQKTDAEIQSYGGATPNVAPTRPANIPYGLPPTGLRPPYNQTDKYVPPDLPLSSGGAQFKTTYTLGDEVPISEFEREQIIKLMQKQREDARKKQREIDDAADAKKAKPAKNSQDQEALNDRRIKTEAVIAGSSLALENPKKAAATVTKDSIGKYVASLYDTNKEKGVSGSPVGKISETILREYSNDPTKQKKALEILASLSMLDSSAGKIRVA